MIDLTTYALLRKQIASTASGVSDVRAEGDELVFVLADGREVRVAIPATEIRDAVVRDDVLVLTLEDDKEIVVDATLTQSGQAADAKVTGDALAYKLTEPSDGLAVGKYFRIASMDDTGHAVLEAVNLPIAADKHAGMVQVSNYDGWYMYGNRLQARTIESANYAGMNNTAIIGKGTLNSILSTPSVMPPLTAEEQAAARERMGLPGEYELLFSGKVENVNAFKIECNKKIDRLLVIMKCTSVEVSGGSLGLHYKKNNVDVMAPSLMAQVTANNRQTVFEFYNNFGIRRARSWMCGDEASHWWDTSNVNQVGYSDSFEKNDWVGDIDTISISHNNNKIFTAEVSVYICEVNT